MHGTSLLSTPGHFGPVSFPYVSKNEDEEHCFLKQFDFSNLQILLQPLILHWLIVVVNAGFVTFHVVQCLNKFRPAAHTGIWPQIDHFLQTCASRTILSCIKFN